MMIKLVVISIYIVQLVYGQSNPYCTPNSGTYQGPPIPSLATTFATHMEANFVTKNYTTDTELYYNYDSRKASIRMQFRNTDLNLIYNYADDEIYAVERIANQTDSPYGCIAYKLSTTSELNVFMGANKLNDTYIMPNTIQQVLHFNNVLQVYNGTDTIRGIPVNKWTSCHSWPEMNAYFTVVYSFSQPNYQMPYLEGAQNQIPVRAEVKGVVAQGSNLVPFETIYDFYHYQPIVGNDNYQNRFLQTPPGVYCAGRKETKKPPKVSARYAYSEELIQVDEVQEGGTVSYLKKIYYDSELKLVRYEVRNKVADETTFNVKDPLIIIHDYNIGIAYGINKIYGNCSVQALSNSSFDSDSNYTSSMVEQGLGFAVQLKNPESFLHLDSVYIYTGQRMKNGIPVDVFISNRTDKYGPVSLQSIHEYEFLADGVLESTIDNIGRNLPVSLTISIPQLDKTFRYNYYDFEMNFNDLSVFDLRQCFNGETSKRFLIVFPYKDQIDYEFFAFNFIQSLEQFMYFVLQTETKESGLRFAPVKISVSQNGNFYVTSAIYAPPPPIALFTKLDRSILVTASYISLSNLTSAEQCAEYCQKRVPCLSFDWCPSSNRCYLNAKHVTDQSTSIGSSQCDHYSRNTIEQVNIKTINEIYTLLDNTVALGLFKLEVPIVVSGGVLNLNFKASEIREMTESNGGGDVDAVSRFYKINPRTRFASAKDRFFTGYSISDCASACSNEATFSCETFDYCYANGECRISRNDTIAEADLVSDSTCDIYQSKNHNHSFLLSVTLFLSYRGCFISLF